MTWNIMLKDIISESSLSKEIWQNRIENYLSRKHVKLPRIAGALCYQFSINPLTPQGCIQNSIKVLLILSKCLKIEYHRNGKICIKNLSFSELPRWFYMQLHN